MSKFLFVRKHYLFIFSNQKTFSLKISFLKINIRVWIFFFCKQWSNYIESTLLQCALLQTKLKCEDIFSLRLYCFLLLLFWGVVSLLLLFLLLLVFFPTAWWRWQLYVNPHYINGMSDKDIFRMFAFLWPTNDKGLSLRYKHKFIKESLRFEWFVFVHII